MSSMVRNDQRRNSDSFDGQGSANISSNTTNSNACRTGTASPASEPLSPQTRRRWTDTIRAVMKDTGEKKKWADSSLQLTSPAKEVPGDARDGVGERVTLELNRRAIFSWHDREKAFGTEVESGDTFQGPLLGGRNFRRIKRSWSARRMLPNLLRFIRDVWQSLTRYRITIRSTFRVLGMLLVLSVGLMVFFVYRATMRLCHHVFIFSGSLLSLLVDLDELRGACPKFLVWAWAMLLAVGRLIDRTVLLGGRFGGRDWDRDKHLQIGPPDCPSRHEPLSKCPPPYAAMLGRRRCMDPQELASLEPNWSHATLRHVLSIQFCYIMMHDEFRRKQSKRRSSFTTSTSAPLESEGEQGDLDAILDSEIDVATILSSLPPQETSKDSSVPSIEELLPQLDLEISASDETRRQSGSVRRTKITTRAIEGPEEIELIDRHGRVSLPRFRDRVHSDGDLAGSSIDLRDSLEENDAKDDTSVSTSSSALRPKSPPQRHLRRASSNGSLLMNDSEIGDELDWLDVGTHIGMRLLKSEHLQRAVASQDTAERIMDIGRQVENTLMKAGKMDDDVDSTQRVHKNGLVVGSESRPDRGSVAATPPKPINSMWTSPTSPARSTITKANAQSDTTAFDQREWRENREPNQHAQDRTTSPLQDALHTKPMSFSLVSSPFEVVQAGDISVAGNASPPRWWNRRPLLAEGIKIVLPIAPIQPWSQWADGATNDQSLQIGTVVSSKRIIVREKGQQVPHTMGYTNCLSITAKLDKSFLRNGEFAELTMRIMDGWSSRYMPQHSKFPVGACVATTFGLGVLVGWRVEDDCHIVRALWQRRGAGSGCAYLNRASLHDTVVAAVGFKVQTTLGLGSVLAFTHGSRDFRCGRYFVRIREEGRNNAKVLEFSQKSILSCDGARFVPVIEHIREAAQFQIRVDTYESALRRQSYAFEGSEIVSKDEKLQRLWSRGAETIWASLLRALEEDKDFDDGMNDFVSSIISFLDRLEEPKPTGGIQETAKKSLVEEENKESVDLLVDDDSQDPAGAWLFKDFFAGIFQSSDMAHTIEVVENQDCSATKTPSPDSYERVFAVIRVLMRTTTIARAESPDQPNLRLALSASYEMLLFVRTVVRVQQKNMSPHSMKVWQHAVQEIVTILGPIKERLHRIGLGIAQRMEKQGQRAKVRILRFVDILLVDEDLLQSVQSGDWSFCLERVEDAMVKARIIDKDSREHYHKTIMFIYSHLAPAAPDGDAFATRKGDSLHHFVLALTLLASPRRSVLKFICKDDVLEILERVLIRVFHRHQDASRMLAIHAANFQTVRQLRMLKDFSFSAKLWIPLLDAADAEFTWIVANMSEQAQDLLCPFAKLLSIYVSQCHKIADGDLTIDWLDFLMEDEAVKLIQEIDSKLIAMVEAFCQDLKEFMVVLPYYPSIDEDILNLMDEVDLDAFLREASDAIVDMDRLAEFIREKSTIAVERFLDYLPKMSIPVERRDIGDGWVLTCRGENGGDLTLSDVDMNRENLTCQVLGGETLFFPMFSGDATDNGEADASSVLSGESSIASAPVVETEVSILDQIRDILMQAQQSGYWRVGVGGVDKTPSDRYVASVLKGLPITPVLDCAIELWRNIEIDDDELLEVVIRDVSYQMKLTEDSQEDVGTSSSSDNHSGVPSVPDGRGSVPKKRLRKESPRQWHRRFNPRVDPTVLFLEMRNLTLNLERFHFRIEKIDRRTIFDPIFDGHGTVSVRNVQIRLRVECRKRQVPKLGGDLPVPFLYVKDLQVGLEKVKFKVRDTGADWLLNSIVKGLEQNITEALEENLKEQVRGNLDAVIDNMNSHLVVNPDLMLSLLGITMADLEESPVWPAHQ